MKKISLLRKLSLILVMFSTVILLGGCSPEYLQQQGIGTYNYGDYLYSAGHFKLVLDKQPDNPNAYYWLGKNYAAVGDYDTAIVNFKKAIELGGQVTNSKKNYILDPGKAYFDLANAYYGDGEYQEAAKTLKKLNEVNSDTCINSENLYKCTEIYDYSGQVKDAIDLHNRFAYSQNDMSRKYRMLSYLYIRDHNYDAAVNMSVKAIEQMPENELAYYFLGVVSGERGQYDKAVDTIRKAVQFKNSAVSPKKYLPMYITLAGYLSQNGQYDAALAAYNDAIQNTNTKTYSYPSGVRSYYDTATSSYKTYPVYSTGSVSYDDYSSMMALTFTYYNAGKYDDALYLINDYIDNADRGIVGLFLRDSYYLKSAFDSYHYVMSVIPGSPAEKAGLQFGDRIVAVDGVKVKGKSTKEIVNRISGPAGAEVTLKIERYNNPAKKADKIVLEKTLVRENTKNKRELGKLAKAYGLRSLIFRAQGETEKAFSDAQRAIKCNSESFDAKLAWGLANIDKGNYNDAIKILSSAKLPKNERLYGFDMYYFFTPFQSDDELLKLGKAIAYLKLDKVNEAVNYLPTKEISSAAGPLWTEYKNLSSELTKLAQSHNDKAVNLEQKGFLKEALNEYTLAFSFANEEKKEDEIRNKILTLLQEYPVTQSLSEEARKYMVRADVLVKQEDFSAALNECKKALKLAPYFPKIYYNMAGLNGGLKNYEKAIEYMNIYIKLAPEATDIQSAKDEITKWELLIERK